MDRYRLITSIVVLLVYLLALYPVQTIIIGLVLVAAYFFINNINRTNIDNRSSEYRRKEALEAARIYLTPYKSIWRNLKLTNKYCQLMLGPNGTSISAKEKHPPFRRFEVTNSRVHSRFDLWNMFCKSFDHLTTFDGLVQQCNVFNVDINISDAEKYVDVQKTDQVKEVPQSTQAVQVDIDTNSNKKYKKEKIDINNASEVEITALPGVSIVMAKKLIKKREEIRGFKTIDDVCIFLRLRPHMEKQLRELICVNKMKGSIKIMRNKERSIDL